MSQEPEVTISMGIDRPLTLDDIKTYERDGVVALRGAFSESWIDLLREGVRSALAAPGAGSETYEQDRFFGDLDLWRRTEGFGDFVLHSPAGEIAAAMMKSETATFLYDQMLVKEPRAMVRTPWHQDQPYWAVSGRQVCSIWTPLDPVGRDVSLEFVRGSHLWSEHNPQHFLDQTPYEGTGLPDLPDIESARDQYDIVGFDLEPGDCLVFQAMIVHGAPGNSSQCTRRRAYSTRWLGDDARYCDRKGEVAVPTFKTGLKHGDRFEGKHFPLVWPRLARTREVGGE
jgi:ectoine hydroxylase-related dioxygenase (phytanoyl-CoA dioxygenase family)